jgi:hypothetical protein
MRDPAVPSSDPRRFDEKRRTLASLDANGRLSFRIAREGDLLVAEWLGVGVLRATENGSWSEFVPAAGIDPRHVQKLRDGAVLALLRHLEGKLSLHASAVAVEGVAIVCIGDPGAGKSTAVADLCLRSGAEFLCDDVASLDLAREAITVLPSREEHWLLPESREALGVVACDEGGRKAPLSPSAKAREEVPLGAIVALAFDDDATAPRLEPVRGASRFSQIHASLFRFLVDAQEVNVRDFTMMIDLAERAPMFILRRPRDLTGIERSSEALVGLARRCNEERAR